MSHFTTISTRITSVAHLSRALTDVGCRDVEVHATPVKLSGFGGVFNSQAEVVVRARKAGGNKYDLGFERAADGFFRAQVVNEDREQFGAAWLGRVHQRYAYQVARDMLAEQGFELTGEQTTTDQALHLTLRRMT